MSTTFSGAEVPWADPAAGEDESAQRDLNLLREAVRKVVTGAIAPEVAAMERNGSMPDTVFKALVETDFHAVGIPARYGGAGAGLLEAVVVIEEVARVSAAASVIPAQGFVASCTLGGFESDSEQGALLSAIAKGEIVATSPLAGSSAPGVAAKSGLDGWTLEGAFDWVPWPYPDAEVALLAEVHADGGPRLLALRLQGDAARISENRPMLGLRGTPLRSLGFSGVEVPSGAVTADARRSQLVRWRTARLVAAAAQATGVAIMALEEAGFYVRERRQFGRAIGDFQALRVMIADMATRVESARHLTYAAAVATTSAPAPQAQLLAASAKVHASEVAMGVATDAVQLFGGYGFMKDYPVERAMRDAKMIQLLAGERLEQQCTIADILAEKGSRPDSAGSRPG